MISDDLRVQPTNGRLRNALHRAKQFSDDPVNLQRLQTLRRQRTTWFDRPEIALRHLHATPAQTWLWLYTYAADAIRAGWTAEKVRGEFRDLHLLGITVPPLAP